MQRAMVLGAVVVLVVGCSDKRKEAESPPAKVAASATDVAQPTPAATPTPPPAPAPTSPCDDYRAAIERLKACTKVEAAMRDTLVGVYESDVKAWPNARPGTDSLVQQSCAQRAATIVSVLDSSCGPPITELDDAKLRSEIDKTNMALEVARSMSTSPQFDDAAHAAAQRDAERLAKELVALEAELAKRVSAGTATSTGARQNVTIPKECIDNPLAAGCS
jgi:hypothetical protein